MSDSEVPTFTVLGCRGSHPTPGPETALYGGETTCYQLRCGAGRLFVDAGTGLRSLGAEADGPDILLSHLHLDHLLGLGPLAPHLSEERPATLWWAGDLETARRALHFLYSPPFWPISLMQRGLLRLRMLAFGTENALGPFMVTPFALHHPGGCFGLDITAAGRRVLIAADHEHGAQATDREVEQRAAGADLVVYDAAYSDEEHARRVGWGHSTRERALDLAKRAQPGLLLMTHHEPDASDGFLATEAGRLGLSDTPAARGAALLARQGMRIALERPAPRLLPPAPAR